MVAKKKEVLFTRAEPALVDAIDRETQRRRARDPGCRLSRSDVIRSILWGALVPRPADVETPKPEAGK